MELRGRTVLQLFAFLTINGLRSSSQFQDNSLEYQSSNSRSPIIVLIRSANEARLLEDDLNRGFSESSYSDSYRNYKSAKSKSINDLFYALTRGNDDQGALRTEKFDEMDSAERLQQEIMIAKALRSHCEAKIVCEMQCPQVQQPTTCPPGVLDIECPELVPYCPKSCKAVFDDLLLCPNQPVNNSPKRHGKTMPPKPDKFCA